MAGSQANRQNRAAALTAGILGVVLIGVSAPFTIALWEDERAPWGVAWDQAAHAGTGSASLSGIGEEQEASLNFTDTLPGSVQVEVTCSDTPGTGQEEAQMDLILYEGETELARTAGSCTELSSQPWNVTFGHPDVEGTDGTGQSAAQDQLDERLEEEQRSATFRVVASASRASTVPGPLPIPVPIPDGGFSADIQMTGSVWEATAVPQGPEVVR